MDTINSTVFLIFCGITTVALLTVLKSTPPGQS